MRLLKHPWLITLTVIATLGLALPAHARSLEAIQDSGYIKIVTTTSSPPHGFLDPQSNELCGIMFQVGRAIAEHLSVTPRFDEVPFAGLIPSLKSNRAELMSGPLFITEKRAEQVAFTQPVYGWGEGIVVPVGTEKEIYKNFKDLAGHTVGALAASVQLDMLHNLKGTNVKTYKSYSLLLQDLRAGRLDAAIIDPPSIAYRIKAKGIEGIRLVKSYDPKKQWWVGLAVRKGNKSLLNAVNKALTEMKRSGELKDILSEWGIAHLAAPLETS